MTPDASPLFDVELPETDVLQVVSLLMPLFLPGVWLFLEGDLGAGKTTLTRALLGALGAHDAGRSPTFSLVDVVALPRPRVTQGGNLTRVLHLDLYRLKSGRELNFLGLETEFRKGTAAVVEWASQVAEDEWEDFFQTTGCRRPTRILTLGIRRADGGSEGAPVRRRYVLTETPFSLP